MGESITIRPAFQASRSLGWLFEVALPALAGGQSDVIFRFDVYATCDADWRRRVSVKLPMGDSFNRLIARCREALVLRECRVSIRVAPMRRHCYCARR